METEINTYTTDVKEKHLDNKNKMIKIKIKLIKNWQAMF